MAEKKKVVITFPYDPHVIPGYDNYVAEFEQKGFEVFLDQRFHRLNQDEIIEVLQKHNAYAYVLSGEIINNKILDACPSVKLYVKMGAGADKIDRNACTEHGVVVATTPGANAEAVAEHALAMMLALTRKIVMLDTTIRQGVFKQVFGTSMLRKTLGIVGFGAIGKNVAKFVRGLDMRVLVYDVYQDEEFAKKYGCDFVPLETLLKESDFITIHAPLLDETANMISTKEFAVMKPGALICNCARGGIVDEKAMIEALKSGKIKGAALDAFSVEPLPLSSELYKLENVILSPHTAGMTYEGRGKVVQMAFQNVLELSEGKIPYGIVNNESLSTG
jgi:D-3-phosphoglycerate dehydrogenase